METVNIHGAKTPRSRLIERTVNGGALVIARAGKPLGKVAAIDAPDDTASRPGSMPAMAVPEDFDRMGADGIAGMVGIAE